MLATPPDRDIQKAVFDRLTGDAELSGMLAGDGVYDELLESAELPYVIIGETFSTPSNTQQRFGWVSVVTVHAWSGELGHVELQGIVARIIQLIDHQPTAMALPNHHVRAANYEFHQLIRDNDPEKLRHGVVRFRVATEQNDD